MDQLSNETPAFACDLTAIPAETRQEHVIAAPQLFSLAQEVHELPDGYAIRFRNEPGRFMSIATFIENERLCCPFFQFVLEVEPNGGPLWLKLTGGEGVKELLRSTFLESSENESALKGSIQTGGDAHLEQVVAQTSFPSLAGVLKKEG